MADLLHALHVFELRILEKNPGTKSFIDRDVYVAANSGGDHKAGVLPVIRRKVGAAAAEAYPQWTSGDDHRARLACSERAIQRNAPPTKEARDTEVDKCPHPGQRAHAII